MLNFYNTIFDRYHLSVWLQSPDMLGIAPRSFLTKHIIEEIKSHKTQIIDVLKSQPVCSCGAFDWRYEPLAYDEAGGFVCRKCLNARSLDVNTRNPPSSGLHKRIEDLFDDIVVVEIEPGVDLPVGEPIDHPESPPDICAQCGAKKSIDTILGLSETGIWLCSKCYYSKKKRKSKKKAAL
ncbi:MAG: hypothetical protein ACYC27_23250 [Armatimonadota bacterium]